VSRRPEASQGRASSSTDELVRREIDGEITAAERAELDARCAADPPLGVERQALANLHAEARTLGAAGPPISPDFTDQVMRRLAPAPASQGALAWLLRPQPVRLRPLTALLAVGAVAAALALLWRPTLPGPRPAPTPPPVAVRQAPVAPASCPADTVLVRFVFHGARSHRVALAGDFNGWRTDDIVLVDAMGNGVFSATVPLKAGETYGYMFVVDGARWTEDPLADAFRPDGFGRRNSLLRL